MRAVQQVSIQMVVIAIMQSVLDAALWLSKLPDLAQLKTLFSKANTHANTIILLWAFHHYLDERITLYTMSPLSLNIEAIPITRATRTANR